MSITREEWPENRPLEKVCEPDEIDVLFSPTDSAITAAAPNEIEGNDSFLQLIEQHAQEYQNKSQLEKPMVTLDILHKWRNRGGRFLKYDEKTRLWNDVGDKKARQRIVKALKTSSSSTESMNEKSEGNIQYSSVSDESDSALHVSGEPRGTLAQAAELASIPKVSRRVSTKLNYAREGKLYGRQAQHEELLQVYYQVTDGSLQQQHQFVLISGETGNGKTALAHSLRPVVDSDGGFFLETKFEEIGQESTAALVDALSDFVSQLLQRDEATIELYRAAIKTVVEEEARVLVSLIPGLEKLLGSDYQGRFTMVEGGQRSQAAKRSKYVFQSFIQAIATATPECPIVMLFDDLHWANESSLQVLASLVASIDGVLFVGTYRDKDSTTRARSLLNETMDRLSTEEVAIRRIPLTNLEEDAVRFMLADALMLDSGQLKMIAQLTYSMTQGNVLFLVELLRSLQDEELLQFDEESKQWTCDSHMIQVAVDAKTVSDLFKSKIGELPTHAQEMLKIASCFGSRLDPYLLQQLLGENVLSSLNMAASRGLLVCDVNSGTFSFAHDGIQHATYSLIADAGKPSFHLKIGQKLTRKLDTKDLENHLFVVTRQLMLGDSSVTDHAEQAVLASLYLRAGEKAVEQSNFETALLYLRHGVDLLSDDHWKSSYDLTLRLSNAAAEVFYCTAHFNDVEIMVNTILLNARSFEETLRARATQICTLSSRNHQPEAIQSGLDTLKELGEELPSYPSGTQVAFAQWRVKRKLRGMSDTSLMRLPVMKVSRKVAAMQMLNLIWLSALYSRPLLAAAVAVRMVKLTVTYGKCAVSCVGFGFYAMLLCSGGSNIDEGYRYGKLAMEMYNEFQNETWLCRVSAAFHGCVCTWKEPASGTIKPLDHAYRVGLGTGDIEFAVLCASMNCWNNSGRYPLPLLDKEIHSLAERVDFLGQETAFLFLKPLWQMTQNFMGQAKSDPKVLTGDIMNQEILTAEVSESCPGLIVWIRCYCMILAYTFGDFDRAEAFSSTAHEIYDHSYGAMDAAFILFFETMTLLAQARKGKRGRTTAARKRLKLLRHWAKHSPLNFLGKQYLIEAELAVVTGDRLSVLSKYTSAIALSREEGFLMQEALANERVGKYYLSRGEETTALPFLRKATQLYEQWGGSEKVRHLQEELKPLQIGSL